MGWKWKAICYRGLKIFLFEIYNVLKYCTTFGYADDLTTMNTRHNDFETNDTFTRKWVHEWIKYTGMDNITLKKKIYQLKYWMKNG